jgi:hypothetical protein
VDETVVIFFRPELLPLAVEKPVAWHESRTRPVYVNVKYKDRKTVIYRVVRPGGPAPLPGESTIRDQVGQLNHYPNHFFHGVLAMRAESWQAAAGEFAMVIRADSSNTVAFNNRAWCLLRAGIALGNAEDNARTAVEREPDNVDYLDTLISVLLAVGKSEEAESYRARMESISAVNGGAKEGGD